MKRFSILLTVFLLMLAGSAAAQEERELTKAEKKALQERIDSLQHAEAVEAIESKALDENLTRVKVKVTLKNGKTKNESIKVTKVDDSFKIAILDA